MKKKAVLIITHGKFGVELLKSVEMIMGEQEDANALSLCLGDSVDDLRNAAERIIVENEKLNKDTIVLVDILGGSPSNIALYMLKKYNNIKVITGVNMLMLIELFQSRDYGDLDELVEKMINSSVDGIKKIEFSEKGKWLIMGQILLARVDDRLIHGQVMTKWSKGMNTNALFVVDNETAADPFMKDIYMMSTSNTGVTIKVLSIDEAVDYWNKDNFGKYRAILLFKTIGAVKEAIDKGLPIERLNLGGIAKSKDSKFVIPNVAVKPEELEVLKEIESKGVEVFFQVVPDTKAVSLKDAIKSY